MQALIVGVAEGGVNLELPSLNILRKLRSVADFTQDLFRLSEKLGLRHSGRGRFLVGEIVGSEAGV